MTRETLQLSRRGFFGAAAAALVAAVAPRRAYSFLTANPLAAPFAVVLYAGQATWNGAPYPPDVMTLTSAEQGREMFGDGRCDSFFPPAKLVTSEIGYTEPVETLVVAKQTGRFTLEQIFNAKESNE